MDLHGLEYIVEIANVHNLSRAAENLFITQSTLSQHLSKLEAELGVSLFERKRNEMSLTPAGKMYVEACRHILDEKKDLYNRLSDLENAKTGSFSVGITPQWGAVALSHIMGKFRALYPTVKVKAEEEIATPLVHLLQQGEIDMAILPLANDSKLPFKGILLRAEELILAIPAAHAKTIPLRNRDAKDGLPQVLIEDLSEEPMIFSRNQTTIRKLQDQCFSSRHVVPRIIMEINSHPASLVMVEEELGSTFLPVSCAVPSDRIVYAHAVPIVQWYVTVAFRKGFVMNQCEQYFVSLLQDYFTHNIPAV
jgi:DNA-binding transcriptional LysR family regulator